MLGAHCSDLQYITQTRLLKFKNYFDVYFIIILFSVPIGVPGATSGSMFTPIPVEVTAYDPEVTGLDLLHKTKFAKMRQVEPIPDLARVSEGTLKLEMNKKL